MKVLISGASGMIGSAVAAAARAASMDVVRLVRRQSEESSEAIFWNPADVAEPVDLVRLEGFDAVVHLSGASVARRWNAAVKREIVASRVESTRILCTALAQVRNRPRVLLSASGSGIYGSRGDEVLTEASTLGSGFLADTCRAWEAATHPAAEAGVRVVSLRCGLVLDPKRGALAAMLPPFRAGLGGRLGSGWQWVSWITLSDAVRAILFLASRDDSFGAYNIGTPHPVTNRDFARALGSALHRPAVFPVPRFVLRLAFPEFADEGLLASQRMSPERLTDGGFQFEHAEVGSALRALLG